MISRDYSGSGPDGSNYHSPTLIMVNQDQDYKKIAVVEDNSDLFKGVIKIPRPWNLPT